MAKVIMVQGTMSNAGKSLLVAGLCRLFCQDGYRVAPFKSQNMALNSYVTKEGLEIGRAQAMQAEACQIEASVAMNPILLKPTDDVGSQVIVHGRSIGNMRAREYFAFKKKLIPEILVAYEQLANQYDIIVVEGAGSPAEINLKSEDIVNMGLAELLDAPVLLVGDIDPGGVFAQLYGTWALLPKREQDRVQGLIINKFRGDASLLDSGIEMLEERMQIPVLGVVPYMQVTIDDEDSLSEKLRDGGQELLDIVVIRLPHMSNYSDFTVFERRAELSLRYVSRPERIAEADLVILPGSKNTLADLQWLKREGFALLLQERARLGGLIAGICGGYQMLGIEVSDPAGVEIGGSQAGLGILPMRTILEEKKALRQVRGRFASHLSFEWSFLESCPIEGYEIHMGRSWVDTARLKDWFADGNGPGTLAYLRVEKDHEPRSFDTDFAQGMASNAYEEGLIYQNVLGSYVHGIFDAPGNAEALLNALAKRKGIREHYQKRNHKDFAQSQYDLIAQQLREHMDVDQLYRILGIERREMKSKENR